MIAPPSRGGDLSWRLRNWRLRTKLVVLLLVPLLLAAVLGWLRVADSQQSAADLNALVDRVALGQQVAGAAHQLQTERSRAAAYVTSGREEFFRIQYDEQIARSDAMIGSLLSSAAEDFGPTAADAARNAQVRLRGLAHLRAATTDTQYPAAAVTFTYTQMIDTLQVLTRALFTSPNRDLLQQTDDVVLIEDIKEKIQHEHAALLPILASDAASTATDELVTRATAAEIDAVTAEFASAALPASRDLYRRVVSGPDVDNRERIESLTLAALNTGSPLTVPAAEWDSSAVVAADLVRQVEIQLQEQLRTDGAALANAASVDAFRDTVIVAGAVLVALVLLLLVVRSIAGPLRVLRHAAFQIAQIRLPQAIERMQDPENQQSEMAVEPIGVDTREEIGQVARAFDAVHAEAVRLAGEQALLRANVNDIFVNLSRRSQGLVKRQLGLIDKLEADEQDPDHLSDLFQLDHLATRMRRNNENLLVLAGAAELRPRRRRPVPADDVLRAAVSEVEDYQRIVVRRAPGVSVSGPAVNDLVHLMAELLDNATSFSPPESAVVLASSMNAENALVVEISDDGVGIEPSTLQVINSELADPPTVDVAVSRRMGLFVVGRLALRNEIGVRLEPATVGQGMIAIVTVPASLLMSPAEATAAEMATSEFANSGRQGSGTRSGAEPVPAPQPVNALTTRTPAPQQQSHQLFAQERQDHPGLPQQAWPAEPPIVPAPRRESDPPINASNDGGSGPHATRPRLPQQQTPTWPPRPPRPPRPERSTPSADMSPQPGTPQPGTPQPSATPPLPQRTPAPPAPPARQQEPLNDLFESAPGAANPQPQSEDDAPIYDEVRTSWFRLQQRGGNGGGPNGNGNGNGARPGGNGQPDRPQPGNGARRPMAEGPTAEDRAPGTHPAGPRPGGNGTTGNGTTGNGTTGNGTTGNGSNRTTGNGSSERGVAEPRPASGAQPGDVWSTADSGPHPAPVLDSKPSARPTPKKAEWQPAEAPSSEQTLRTPIQRRAEEAVTDGSEPDRSEPAQPGQRESKQPDSPTKQPEPAAAEATPSSPPAQEPSAAFTPTASEWGPIENGWLAAREFTELAREYLTESGLPKRRRGSTPLPGSFSEPTPSNEPTPRNPEAVRGRLREYQQGLRHGRYAQRGSAQSGLAEHPGSARGSE